MGELANHPLIPIGTSKHATICTKSDFMSLDNSVTRLSVGSNCNDASLTVLDLSRFLYLRQLVVGDESCMYVNEVKLIGLNTLKSVEIGMNSFTKKKNSLGNDPNRHFYLKNCPKLKSLKMDRNSFSDYTVCGIENVDALEVIEMGNANDLDDWSGSFYYASLELKSILIHSK